MTLLTIFTIMTLHWVADFVLQTHKQACGKSSDNVLLSQHVNTYSLVVTLGVWGFRFLTGLHTSLWDISAFNMVVFATHFTTDYFTSRLNKKLHEKGDIHNFFVSIGFDQLLHYIQLFGFYALIF